LKSTPIDEWPHGTNFFIEKIVPLQTSAPDNIRQAHFVCTRRIPKASHESEGLFCFVVKKELALSERKNKKAKVYVANVEAFGIRYAP